MRALLLALMLVAGTGCFGKLESDLLHLSYQAPKPLRLLKEREGPPPTAMFTGGLVFTDVGEMAVPTDANLPELLGKAFETAKLERDPETVSAKVGSLPAGPVARWELKGPRLRTLAYLVHRPGHAVLVTFSAPEGHFGPQAARIEASLASLQFMK